MNNKLVVFREAVAVLDTPWTKLVLFPLWNVSSNSWNDRSVIRAIVETFDAMLYHADEIEIGFDHDSPVSESGIFSGDVG